MKTTKEILTENRDSIIGAIKFVFSVWKSEDVKLKMTEFLTWADNNEAKIQEANEARNTKTLLRGFVSKMALEQMPKKEKRESLAEMQGAWMERNDYTGFNHLTKKFY